MRGVVIAAILRADIDGGRVRQLAPGKNIVEFRAVGAGEEDVVAA